MDTYFEVHLHENKKLPFYFLQNRSRTNQTVDVYRWHPALEICLCNSGNGRMFCDSFTYDFQEGNLLIVNSNALHNYFTDTKIIFDCLIIDESFLAEVDIDLKNLNFQQLVTDEKAKEYFEQVRESFLASDSLRTARIRCQILRLMIYLCDHYTKSAATYAKSASVSVEMAKIVIGYINVHLTEKLTLDILAKETGLNKYYLCHEFKKMTKHTLFSYINLCRCEKASGLLSKREHTIEEVSQACGFEDASYFNRIFKKYYGISPSVYSKQHI